MRPSVQQQRRQTGHSEATTRARICLGCVHLYSSSAGRLDILKLLREQGYAWDASICTAAVQADWTF